MARAESDAALGDYVALARRRRGSLALGVVLGLLVAVLAYAATPASYRSTTSVIVQPTGDDTNVTNGRTNAVINLDTEAQIVTSSIVATRAAALLKSALPARDLAQQVMVGVPANTSVLNISFTAGQPVAAQRGARAFAAAYLANRKALAEDRLDARRQSLRGSIKTLNDQLQAINQELASGPAALRRDYLSTQRSLLVQQIKAATVTLSPLVTEDVVPGSVITDAQLPTSRTGLSSPVLLGTGLLLGLLLGLALALLRDRTDRRIRERRDLERLGLDVLVDPFELPPAGRIRRFRQAHDEPLRQSRNALLARMLENRGSLVVTSASPGTAGATVAASLAVTMARSGVSTALVCANTESDIVGEAFDVYGGPNLTDVLRGRVDPVRSLRPVEGTPDLMVLPSGSDGSLFSELLQGSNLRPVLGAYERLSQVVVVDVAPTAVNADAQTLVSATQGLVLVVSAGVTTTDEVAAAVDQMSHVGAQLLGVLLVREHGQQDQPLPRPRLAAPSRRPGPSAEEAPVPVRPTRRASRRGRRTPPAEPVLVVGDVGERPTAYVEPVPAQPPAQPVAQPQPPSLLTPVPPASPAPSWSRWDHPPQPPQTPVAPESAPEPAPEPAPQPAAGNHRAPAADPPGDPVGDPLSDPLTDPLPPETLPALEPDPLTRVWRLG